MVASRPAPVSGPGHVVLNAGEDGSDRMTVLVVAASKTAAAGVVAVLGQAGLFGAGEGARRAVCVEDAASLLGRRALRRFPVPRLIVVSHDPVSLIEELGATDPASGVGRARDRIDLLFKVALRAACPVLILSHGLARGPAAELAAVIHPFCGIEASEAPHPASVDTPVVDRGFVTLRPDNARPSDGAARTIVIGGPPRSGTSMIAAVLHAAGLPLGDDLVPSTFENTVQNTLLKPSSPRTWTSVLRGSWTAALAHLRHARLAWDGFDVPAIEALIAERRRDGPVWGLKRPGIGSFIRLGGLRLLDHPRLIMSLRDPVAAAARITRAHDVEVKVALRIACWFLLDSLATARACRAPTLLVSHDAAQGDLPGLVGRLLPFCGLAAGDYEAIAASVARAGATYRKDFAEPFLGEIMDVVDHDLYAWVDGAKTGPVVVDILADGRRIAGGLADQVLEEGRLLVVIPLSPAEVTGATRIRAVIQTSQVELRNSGVTLAELRRS